MGSIIKLANLVQKVKDLAMVSPDDASEINEIVEGADEIFNADWTAFMEGELAASNKNDNHTLGGAQNANEFSDEEEPA